LQRVSFGPTPRSSRGQRSLNSILLLMSSRGPLGGAQPHATAGGFVISLGVRLRDCHSHGSSRGNPAGRLDRRGVHRNRLSSRTTVGRRCFSQSRQFQDRSQSPFAEEYLTCRIQKDFAPRLRCAGPRRWEIMRLCLIDMIANISFLLGRKLNWTPNPASSSPTRKPTAAWQTLTAVPGICSPSPNVPKCPLFRVF
jgi:hypothetical protein